MDDLQFEIARGSKSFHLASRAFARRAREGAWRLYRWCRFVDDEIDLAPSAEVADQRLKALMSSGDPDLQILFTDYGVEPAQTREVLHGLAMDVDNFSYESLSDVELYAYRVAGVVGLMMCKIMDVSEPAAIPHAISLGTAMQLTNIARDVREDLGRGRVYLPANWLGGLRVTDELIELAPERLYPVVLRLLDRADVLYHDGHRGLKYLPVRARLAVAVAATVYRAIGQEIRAIGPPALRRRTVLGPLGKVRAVSRGIGLWLLSFTLPPLWVGTYR